jgi:PAS domain S-box-containing protein
VSRPPAQPRSASPDREQDDDLYEDAPCGYISTTPDGELVRVNRTLLSWTGYTRDELQGRRFQDLLTPGGRIYHETHYAPLLRMQGAVREIALDLVCAGGRHLPVLVNSVLRSGEDGRPQLVNTTVFDATHRRRYERELVLARERERTARRRTERLQRLSAVLAAAVDTRELAAAAVGELADGLGAADVILAVVEPGASQLHVVAHHGAALRPELSDATRTTLEQIMRTRRMLLWSAGAAQADGAPPLDELTGDDSIEALAVLPLATREEPTGVALLCFGERHDFDEEEIAFMDACANQSSQALERARLYDNQRTIAHVLQQSLLADDPPQDARFAVDSRYEPAGDSLDVGGDWHDTFCVGAGTIGLVVGDVVGRGIEAATAMGQLRSAVRALACADFGPAQLLEHLDVFADQLPRARMATLVYAQIELETGRLRYASAGHPPMLLMQPQEPATLIWDGRSIPLGARLGPRSQTVGELEMRPGARLLLYTDGLVEQQATSLDEALAGLTSDFEELRAAPLGTLLDRLLEGGNGSDDVCLLCLQYAPHR